MIRYVQIKRGYKTACWEKDPKLQSTGRPMMKYDGKRRYISRVVASRIFGLDLDQFIDYACHHCDNGRCFRPTHLFVGTSADNAQDCINKGRRPPRKLTPIQQELIYRYHLTNQFSMREMSNIFQVSLSAIWRTYYRQQERYL